MRSFLTEILSNLAMFYMVIFLKNKEKLPLKDLEKDNLNV